MSDLELKRKESLTKAEVAKRLSAFAKALAAGTTSSWRWAARR